jgi:hypothetical protein
VTDAQAALTRAQHPYTDDEIAAARAQLQQAQHDLALAQAATPAPAVATVAVVTEVKQAPVVAQQTGPAAGAAPAGGGAVGALASAGTCSGNFCIAAATQASPAAVPAPAAATTTVAPAASAVAQPAQPVTAEARSGAPAAPAVNGDVTALQRKVAAAQKRLDAVNAPPDPAQVKAAQDGLAQAQQQLAVLQAAAAQAAAPAPSSGAQTGSGDAGSTASSASAAAGAASTAAQDQVQSAQLRLAQAQQLLVALNQRPSDSTVASARTELDAAKQAFQALYDQADAGVRAQIDADPQTALESGASSSASGLPDLARQIGRLYLSSSLADVFVQQMAVESEDFSPDVVSGRVVSPAGATGVAQLMPSSYPDVNPLNPVASLIAAAGTMRDNLARYGGDLRKALAAYNAGAGRVDAAVAGLGSGWEAGLPAETQLYLLLILGAAGS